MFVRMQFVVVQAGKKTMNTSFDLDPWANDNWQDALNEWNLKPPKSIMSVICDSDAVSTNQRLMKSFVLALVKNAAAAGELSLLLMLRVCLVVAVYKIHNVGHMKQLSCLWLSAGTK